MEGPSIVIACEEFAPYRHRRITASSGTVPFGAEMKGKSLEDCFSWGKHFVLIFKTFSLRVHFLMFGSYRINNPRENRIPKLELHVGKDVIYFYSCAMKKIPGDLRAEYDSTVDLMSEEWDSAKATKALRAKPKAQVCDILMDQNIFAGLGNIMKNEILFRRRLHPETLVGNLNAREQSALCRESRKYAGQFYAWKKANVLKRNWQIFRKKTCPECDGPVTKEPTGKLERISHYCPREQKLKR